MTLTTVNPALLDTQAQYTGFKNRIINGAMVIDQRNAGASVTIVTNNTYCVDRFTAISSQSSKYSLQQNAGAVTPPAGFTNYLGATSLSAYTVGASENFAIRQIIEGYNIADLAWGTASAAAVTLSFWVRSSLTGTFGGSLRNSAINRSYPFSYSISSANTWEQKSITIAGDTTGTWVTNNGEGILAVWSLGTGSTLSGTAGAWAAGDFRSATGAVSVVGTNGATFYITGVQLEKGSTATSFDYRPYGTELALCQRYYFRNNYTGSNKSVAMFQAYQSNGVFGKFFDLPVQMRATPTCSASSATHFSASQANSALSAFTTITFGDSTQNLVASGGLATAGSLVAGNASNVVSTSSSGYIDASAEL